MALSERIVQVVDRQFAPSQRDAALTALVAWQAPNDRIRLAALRLGDGDLAKLGSAIDLAKVDWRDLLVAAGFADDVQAHHRWMP